MKNLIASDLKIGHNVLLDNLMGYGIIARIRHIMLDSGKEMFSFRLKYLKCMAEYMLEINDEIQHE